MGLVVTYANTNYSPYYFDDSFVLREQDLTSRSRVQQAALQTGGKDPLGKAIFEAADIELVGVIHGESRADFQSEMDDLLTNCNRVDMYLYPDQDLDRYIHLKRLAGVKRQFANGLQFRVAQVGLTFLSEDPLWNSSSESSDIRTLTNADYFTLTNNGTADCYVTFTLQALANNTGIAFKNTSDGDQLLTYTDLAFTNGSTLVMNGVEGTVNLGSSNSIRFITGSFIKLVPGVNTIYYEGENVYASINFRERYL